MNDGVLMLAICASKSEPPLEQPVTLIVGGLLVSGYVISYETYLKHHPLTQELAAAENDWAERHPEEAAVEYPPQFLHLRDARYFAPGQTPVPAEGTVYCRLSLDAIQGFSLGVLEVASAAK
jgi:hypothetical protein